LTLCRAGEYTDILLALLARRYILIAYEKETAGWFRTGNRK